MMAMHAVHAPERSFAAVGIEAVFDDLGQDEISVVVALLRAVNEFARVGEQASDGGNGVGPKEREFERARGVEREFVGRHEVGDPLIVDRRVEREDFFE